jgi:hypothetical protein
MLSPKVRKCCQLFRIHIIIQHSFKKKLLARHWWCRPVILAVRRLRQEDWEFEASLGYTNKCCLKNEEEEEEKEEKEKEERRELRKEKGEEEEERRRGEEEERRREEGKRGTGGEGRRRKRRRENFSFPDNPQPLLLPHGSDCISYSSLNQAMRQGWWEKVIEHRGCS